MEKEEERKRGRDLFHQNAANDRRVNIQSLYIGKGLPIRHNLDLQHVDIWQERGVSMTFQQW